MCVADGLVVVVVVEVVVVYGLHLCVVYETSCSSAVSVPHLVAFVDCLREESQTQTLIWQIPYIAVSPSGLESFSCSFLSSAEMVEMMGPIKRGRTEAKPPLCISVFFFFRERVLFEIFRRIFLCLAKRCLVVGESFTRPLTTFQQHSQTALVKSLSHNVFNN